MKVFSIFLPKCNQVGRGNKKWIFNEPPASDENRFHYPQLRLIRDKIVYKTVAEISINRLNPPNPMLMAILPFSR